MKRPAFIITDWPLFNAAVPPRVKSVIGHTLAWSGHNPSIGVLATRSGLRRENVVAAQRSIERNLLGEYARPKRHAENEETNRLVSLNPGARPRRDKWFTCVPHAALEGLARGRGVQNAHLYPLVLALYFREQRRRGAIQIEDAVAAAMLGLSEAQVKRIRLGLTKSGALIRVRKAQPRTSTVSGTSRPTSRSSTRTGRPAFTSSRFGTMPRLSSSSQAPARSNPSTPTAPG